MYLSSSVFLIGFALAANSAWAMGKAPPAVPPSPPAPAVNTVQDSFESATRELEAAEQMLTDQKYGDAILAAKKIVDRVSLMNPKSNYSTPIPISGILTDADLAKPFSQLSNRQKQALAKAIGDYEGGYYLDLLNLEKRAKLVYLKAFYQKTKGSMLQEDIDKLRDDLVAIHDISIFVKDSQTSDTYLLFDVDVANPDQQYFFDRELTEFAVSTKELKLTEEGFLKLLEKSREERMTEQTGRSQGQENTWDVAECMIYTAHSSQLYYDDRKSLCETSRGQLAVQEYVACFNKTKPVMEYYDDAIEVCNREVTSK